MDENTKKGIKRLAQGAEVGIARSILRWKYKKEGMVPPDEDALEIRSQQVADKARDVIVKRGGNVWNEIKKIYMKTGTKGDPSE